jgi:DNA-binding response OmpR family regulator
MPRHRVLVVEDELMLAALIEETLTANGYDVVGPAPRLPRALELAASAGIDAALLDVNLHGEMVFPVAQVLRGRGIPWAFLTGYGNENIPQEYRRCVVLTKPFRAGDMLLVLQSLMATRGQPPGAPLGAQYVARPGQLAMGAPPPLR